MCGRISLGCERDRLGLWGVCLVWFGWRPSARAPIKCPLGANGGHTTFSVLFLFARLIAVAAIDAATHTFIHAPTYAHT